MSTTKKPVATPASDVRTKHQQVIDLLNRDGGATIEEMAAIASWLTHSTRAHLIGLKKRGYAIDSVKVDGVRHYRITAMPVKA